MGNVTDCPADSDLPEMPAGWSLSGDERTLPELLGKLDL
jgi:hypothetical protein